MRRYSSLPRAYVLRTRSGRERAPVPRLAGWARPDDDHDVSSGHTLATKDVPMSSARTYTVVDQFDEDEFPRASAKYDELAFGGI